MNDQHSIAYSVSEAIAVAAPPQSGNAGVGQPPRGMGFGGELDHADDRDAPNQ